MSPIDWLIRNGTNLLMEDPLRRRHYVHWLRVNQSKTPKELKDIQLKKLKAIIKYAYSCIPYYHQLFRASKFKPEDLKNTDDLKKIPVTTKKDVQNNYPNIFPRGINISKHRVFYTSGSTGMPLKIVINQKENNYSHALMHYTFTECGLSRKDKVATIASPHPSHIMPFLKDITYKGSKLIPIQDHPENIVSTLRQFKPDVIHTYPSMLAILSHSDVSGINPRLIFTVSETLPQHYRILVRRAFGVEINDAYGSVEFSRLAFECNEHSGLHMITDRAVLEFLNDGEQVSPGEPGEIIVTGLYNYTMPLIRYNLGDVGVPSDERCACGRNWPLIKSIQGRTTDYIVLPDRKKITTSGVWQCVYHEIVVSPFCFSQFQIVQEKIKKFLLKFVRGKEFDAKVIMKIKQNIEEYFLRLGYEVTIDVRIVDDIPMDRTGKRRSIISLVT